MKDKIKGLVIGLCLGTLIAGSVAFASGLQLEVYLNHIKYMIDGVKKTPNPDQAGFTYKGSVYVPLRFVSEMLGEQVSWDKSTRTVWIGDQTVALEIAEYKNGTVYKKELDTYLAIMQIYYADYSKLLNDIYFQNGMLKDLIAMKILKERGMAVTPLSFKDKAVQQLAELKALHTPTSPEQKTWEQRLAELKLTEDIILNYLEDRLIGNEYIASKVIESNLRDDYAAQSKTNEFVIATVSHILILTKPFGKPERSLEDALKLANEVEAKLANGETIADLAKQYSDDPGSSDNGGRYVNINFNKWVHEFKKAAIELPLNQISKPIESKYGYDIIRVEAIRTQTFDEVKKGLSSKYLYTIYQDFLDKELPKLIVNTNLNKKDVPK